MAGHKSGTPAITMSANANERVVHQGIPAEVTSRMIGGAIEESETKKHVRYRGTTLAGSLPHVQSPGVPANGRDQPRATSFTPTVLIITMQAPPNRRQGQEAWR